MVDWGASGRLDEYRFALVDPFTLDETSVVDADKVSLTWGYYTDNIVSGKVPLVGYSYRQGGLDRMVRIYHRVTISGESSERCLATLFVDDVGTTALRGRREQSLKCYSALWRFTQDILSQDFFRAAGYNVVQAIRDIVEVDGGKLLVGFGVDEAKNFGNDIWFEVGQNRATTIRTIASWIRCIVGVSPEGYITLEPYVDPQTKPPKYAFYAGQNCVYLSGIEWTTNRGEPINRVIAYYSRDRINEDDPFPATDRVVVDLDDGSEFSYARGGRRRGHLLKISEPCSHEELEDRARIYLAENSGANLYIEIEHVGIPGLYIGDVVTYENDSDTASMINTCLITEIDMALGKGNMCKTKLKVLS